MLNVEQLPMTTPGAMIEGRRHNILPASRSLEDFRPQTGWPPPVKNVPSIMAGQNADVYKIFAGSQYNFKYTVKNSLPHNSFCFSAFFLGLSDVVFNTHLSISDGVYCTWSHHQFRTEWSRLFVAHEFPQRPDEIAISVVVQMAGHPCDSGPPEFAVAMLCVEEGLFPTSPITPPSMPYRDGESLYISVDKIDSMRDATEGHMLLLYTPYWYPEQLSGDLNYTVFAGIDKRGSQLFELSHDPQLRGSLILDIRGAGRFKSNIAIPQSGPYAVSIDWNNMDVEVFVDGIRHINCPFNLPINKCDNLYVASNANNKENSLFCSIQQMKIYGSSIRGAELRNLLYLIDSDKFNRYEAEFQVKLVENLILFENRIKDASSIINKILKWCTLAREIKNLVEESDYRNNLFALLKMSDFISSREDENVYGRTDIVVPVKKDDGNIFNLRIEMKIWGRNDYKEVPSKPIKYMDETETFGIYVMISENANDAKKRKFIGFAKSNKEFANSGIIENSPLGAELPFHFFSIHHKEEQGSNKIILCILCSRA